MSDSTLKTNTEALLPTLESCLQPPSLRSKACNWYPNPDNFGCILATNKPQSGQTENPAQATALWRELPRVLRRQMDGRPEAAFLETVGDGYYSPMISSLRLVFSGGTEHVIAWQIPHVHDFGNYPLTVSVNGKPIIFKDTQKLSLLAHRLAGLTPMVVGALGYCCTETDK